MRVAAPILVALVATLMAAAAAAVALMAAAASAAAQIPHLRVRRVVVSCGRPIHRPPYGCALPRARALISSRVSCHTHP